MSIRDQIKTKSAALVKRETVLLPECGVEIQVRGLMSGEAERAGEAKRSADATIALAAEDPATGQPIWMPDSVEDLNEIAALHTVDKTVALQKINELSGLDRLKKLISGLEMNGASPSPFASAGVSTNSERPSASTR